MNAIVETTKGFEAFTNTIINRVEQDQRRYTGITPSPLNSVIKTLNAIVPLLNLPEIKLPDIPNVPAWVASSAGRPADAAWWRGGPRRVGSMGKRGAFLPAGK